MVGTVTRAGYIVVNKTGKLPAPIEVIFQHKRQNNKHGIYLWHWYFQYSQVASEALRHKDVRSLATHIARTGRTKSWTQVVWLWVHKKHSNISQHEKNSEKTIMGKPFMFNIGPRNLNLKAWNQTKKALRDYLMLCVFNLSHSWTIFKFFAILTLINFFSVNILYFLEQFYVYKKTEWKIQTLIVTT